MMPRQEELEYTLECLAERHVKYGVQPQYIRVMRDCLVAAVEEVLGPAFTPEMRAAWTSLYESVHGTMGAAIERERDIRTSRRRIVGLRPEGPPEFMPSLASSAAGARSESPAAAPSPAAGAGAEACSGCPFGFDRAFSPPAHPASPAVGVPSSPARPSPAAAAVAVAGTSPGGHPVGILRHPGSPMLRP